MSPCHPSDERGSKMPNQGNERQCLTLNLNSRPTRSNHLHNAAHVEVMGEQH